MNLFDNSGGQSTNSARSVHKLGNIYNMSKIIVERQEGSLIDRFRPYAVQIDGAGIDVWHIAEIETGFDRVRALLQGE